MTTRALPTRPSRARPVDLGPVDLDAELALLDADACSALDAERDARADDVRPHPLPDTSTDHLAAPDAGGPDADPAGPSLRLRRGLAWATVGTGIALAAHVAGGGAPMPDWQGVLAPWVASAWLAVLLAGRALSLARLTVAVGAAQFLFHTLFMLGSGSGGHGHAHHLHGAPATMPGPPDGMSVHLAHSAPEMVLWHGLGAVASIALLHRGERTLALLRGLLAVLADRLARRLLLPPATVAPAPRALTPVPPRIDDLAASGFFVETFPRRGPPLVLAA
ncbi:MAG: hypothetical protein ACTHW4_06815 [Actinomycetales bacterium]